MTNRKWRTPVFTVFRRRSSQRRTLRALLTCFRALRAMVWNACSTLMASLALVSKYGMLFLLWHQAWALLVVTCEDEEQIIHLSLTVVEDVGVWPMLTCLFSKSILLPSTTKGKFSGSRGLAWIRNSSLQLSSVLKVLGAVTSNTRTQQSAPR